MTDNLTSESLSDRVARQPQPACADILPESSDDLTMSGLHHLVEEQAVRTPQAVAVQAADGTSLTYQQFNQRANQLAHTLRRLGVAPEVCVGLYLERSPELLVAILAILKAGGAYVPLDPGYPTDRLAFILRESRAPVLLSRQSLLSRLPADHIRRLCLDDWDFLAAEPATAPPVHVDAQDLAYVIYTSGSTGQPKGVMVTHGAAGHFTRVARRAFALSCQDRVLQFASLAFDTSVEEIFPCLSSGAALLLRPPDLPGSAGRFFAWCQQRQVSVLDLPTAYWHEVCEQVEQARQAGRALPWPTTLRLVIIGGEQAHLERLVQWQRCVPPGVRLLNTYGPTETTVAVTLWEAPARHVTAGEAEQDILALERVPIGRPLDGSEVYVLDEAMQPVQLGASGELYIGGPGVARGYLHDPVATAQRFVPHPWSTRDGERLYRTGDRVRQRADGQLEWLGRLDQQVKVRGYRIEPGELEQVLRGYPGVREAVVVAQEGELAAYLLGTSLQGSEEQEGQAVRAYLRERVPGYLVPRWVRWVQNWPLTPAGKLDRHALPPLYLTQVHQEPACIGPRTLLEEIIADIWTDVLGIKQVSMHDDFFTSGGHSLLAVRLLARVCEAFQRELSLATFFETPTVAGLAARIEYSNNSMELPIEAVPVPDAAPEEPLPLSYTQQRLWFLDRLQPGNAAYHIATAIHLKGQLDVKELEWSLNEVVRRHGALRTTFATVEEHPVQVVSPACYQVLPVKDLQELPPAQRDGEAHRLARIEAQRPFDLSRASLRAILLRLRVEEHILLLTMHHIVSDGWSMDILFNELAALYRTRTRGCSSGLPEQPVQYASFALWQRKWLQGERLEQRLAYWRRHLVGAPATTELPGDYARPTIQTFQGATYPFLLSATLLERLRALSRREGVTLFMVLLAAFQTLLFYYTGQDDIVVGTPIAARPKIQFEGVIGFFANTLVLRTNLSGNPRFSELLAQVRRVCLGAYAHQDLPFDMLIQALAPARDPGRNPLFQIMFVLQPASQDTIHVPGLMMHLEEIHTGSAQFDLSLELTEAPDGLHGAVEYNTNLFKAATITRIAACLETLLESIVADPEQCLSDLLMRIRTEGVSSVPQDRTGDHVHPWANGRLEHLDRHILLPPHQNRSSLQQPPIVPRNMIELRLSRLFEDLLGVSSIGPKDDFFMLGGHSLLAVRLVTRIQQVFGQELPLSVLFQGATVERLACILRQNRQPWSSSPLVGIQLHGSKQPFFCVHPIGGHVLCYVHLAHQLGPDQPFYGLQAPGLYGEQAPYTNLTDMAACYVEALRRLQPQGPYLLGGWSLGGVVAFEMARQLHEQGQPGNFLALLDSPFPGSRPVPFDDATELAQFMADMKDFVGEDLEASGEDDQDSEVDAQLQELLAQLKLTSTLPSGLQTRQVRHLLQVYLANLRALGNYKPQVYPGKIMLFQPAEEPAPPQETLLSAWEELARGGVNLRILPGDHYSIMRFPHVQTLAHQLADCLAEAQARR